MLTESHIPLHSLSTDSDKVPRLLTVGGSWVKPLRQARQEQEGGRSSSRKQDSQDVLT